MPPGALNEMEQNVFDLVARSFIAAFYPDCQFQTTSVMGKVTPETGEDVLFRANGRSVVDEGWKAVMHKNAQNGDDEPDTSSAAVQLPAFGKGESGAHTPSLNEKWTTPPKPFTEATLLRAMETAGKLVDNEDLRDALKENGIGRPSTRAAIIETLFKRHYIRKERKNLIATPTGTELIDIIREDLLKSAELTGLWEKKLRQIEHHEYDARTFLDELKQMVCQVVTAVLKDSTARRVSANTAPSKASGKGKSKK